MKINTKNNNDNTIDESPITRKKVRVGRSWRRFIGMVTLLCLKASFGVAFCCAIAHGFWTLWDKSVEKAYAMKEQALEYLAPVKVIKEVSDEELGDLIHWISKERGLDPLILTVIADKESTYGKNLYHFEPEKFEQISNKGKHAKASEDERRMLASSHGPFHVLGLSAVDYCNLHWSKLYNPKVGAKCAGTILKVHMDATKEIKDKGQRVRSIFRRWNGEGKRAEAYADDAMSKLATKLYNGLTK